MWQRNCSDNVGRLALISTNWEIVLTKSLLIYTNNASRKMRGICHLYLKFIYVQNSCSGVCFVVLKTPSLKDIPAVSNKCFGHCILLTYQDQKVSNFLLSKDLRVLFKSDRLHYVNNHVGHRFEINFCSK